MGLLHDLHENGGQSPWLDNLRRGYLRSGELQAYVDRGIRGITSNPSIFQKAIADSDDYDEQFASLLGSGSTVDEAYRSEEHTSELQSLMRSSYAVFRLKKNIKKQ